MNPTFHNKGETLHFLFFPYIHKESDRVLKKVYATYTDGKEEEFDSSYRILFDTNRVITSIESKKNHSDGVKYIDDFIKLEKTNLNKIKITEADCKTFGKITKMEHASLTAGKSRSLISNFSPNIQTIGLHTLHATDFEDAVFRSTTQHELDIIEILVKCQNLLDFNSVVCGSQTLLVVSKAVNDTVDDFIENGQLRKGMEMDKFVKALGYMQLYQNTVLYILDSYLKQRYNLTEFTKSCGTDNYFLLKYMFRKYLISFHKLVQLYAPSLLKKLTEKIVKVMPETTSFDIFNLLLLFIPISPQKYINSDIPSFTNTDVCIQVRDAVKEYKRLFKKLYMNTIAHWTMDIKKIFEIGSKDRDLLLRNALKVGFVEESDPKKLINYLELTKEDLENTDLGLYGIKLANRYSIVIPEYVQMFRDTKLKVGVYNSVSSLVNNITNFIDNDFLNELVKAAFTEKYDNTKLPIYKLNRFDKIDHRPQSGTKRNNQKLKSLVREIAHHLYIINYTVRVRKEMGTAGDSTKYNKIIFNTISTLELLTKRYTDFVSTMRIDCIENISKMIDMDKSEKTNGINLYQTPETFSDPDQ